MDLIFFKYMPKNFKINLILGRNGDEQKHVIW